VPLFEVKAGGPDIPDGVYSVIVVDITGPHTRTAQNGPNAGETYTAFDWTFAIDDGPYEGTVLQENSSTASGPRSKLYKWLTALLNGQRPQVGAKFEVTDLRGRRAFATVQRETPDAWPKIVNLGAMPIANLQQGFATATGAPVQAPAPQPPADAIAAMPIRQIVPPQPVQPQAAPAAPVPSTDQLPF
jgi:hypothetical protein